MEHPVATVISGKQKPQKSGMANQVWTRECWKPGTRPEGVGLSTAERVERILECPRSRLQRSSLHPFTEGTVGITALRTVAAEASSPGSGPPKSGRPPQNRVKPAKPAASPEMLRSVHARPFQEDSIPKASDSWRSGAAPGFSAKKLEAPKVQIGQIDVIVEAAAPPAAKPAPAPIDLASRHYLRRL